MSNIGPTIGVTTPSYAGKTGAGGPSFSPPLIGTTNPSVYADFAVGNYWASGAAQTLSTFLTATSATYSGPTTKYVINASGVLTPITPSLSVLPFDYGWSGSAFVARGLLLEGTGANYALQSNTFSTTWTLTNCTVAQNIVGPDNNANSGWTLTATATGAASAGQTIGSESYTLSVYAKSGSDTFLVLGLGGLLTYFNLANGTIGTNGNTSAAIVQLANGWYRCSISQSTAETAITIGGADANGTNSMTAGRTVLIYGAQAEIGTFFTSYIPTTTAALGRTADLFYLSPTGGFSLTAETIYTALTQQSPIAGTATLAILGANNNDLIGLRPANNTLNALNYSGGTSEGTATVTSTINSGLNKMACSSSVAAGSIAALNAVAGTAVSIAAMPTALTHLQIGGDGLTTGDNFGGDYAQAGAWPIAATAAQLQALTT